MCPHEVATGTGFCACCRFQACGLTPAALLEACNLARLSSAAAGGASGGPGNSAADAAAAAAAAARRRKATMSAGRAMSAAGAAAAASRSCSPSMPGSPGPGPVNQRMLGMQRLADIGSSSSSYSLSGVTAQVGQLGSGCSSSAGGSSWSPKAVLYSQQQQAEVYSAKGAAGEGRRGLTTVLSGRRAGQLQPTVPPLQLRPAVFDVSGSSSSSRPGSPAAAAANRAAGSGLLQNNWVGGAATAADVLGDACDSEAELPEVLAVLFDSSKQLVVTAGNSGVIRVSCCGCPAAAMWAACTPTHIADLCAPTLDALRCACNTTAYAAMATQLYASACAEGSTPVACIVGCKAAR